MKMIDSKAILSAASALLISGFMLPTVATAEGLDNVLGDVRFRVESVSQDNSQQDAFAATVRSRLGYLSDSYNGFSLRLELENNTVLSDNYNDTLGEGAQYSVVPDPGFTELDQAYLQYKTERLSAKLGRQLLIFDNQRFVGRVGWRQDRQTFDAISISYAFAEALAFNAAYLDKRRRIFANEKDIESRDVLLNLAYKTPTRQLAVYAYLLEIAEGPKQQSDSFGLSYSRQVKWDELPVNYRVEFATQKSEVASSHSDSHYALAEIGATVAAVNATLGYELLSAGSGPQAFATPLATGHKFNGWADQYLTTPSEGLVDIYFRVAGKIAGGKWLVAYHDFAADEPSALVKDLGTEINAQYLRKFSHGISAGVKYARFNAADLKVDTDKLWLWAGISF